MNIIQKNRSDQSGFTAVEIVIVLVVVGLIAGAGFMVMGRSSSSTGIDTSAKPKPNAVTKATEKDSCFGVSKETIKMMLGDAAKNMTGPSDTGVVDVPGGDKAQTCVFPFVAGATAENSFMIDLGTFASQENLDKSQKYITEVGGEVTGVGESATYLAKDSALTNSRDFALKVRQGLKIYTFEISQPNSSLTFNDATAQVALIKIAQAATL